MSTSPSSSPRHSLEQRALNHVVREAIDFTLNGKFDGAPLLFAVVSGAEVAAHLAGDFNDDGCPFVLVLQEFAEDLSTTEGGLDGYVARLSWPDPVAGAVLSRHIQFTEQLEDKPRPARLVTGVLRTGEQLTVLVTHNDEGGPELHGGDSIAPEIVDILRQGFVV